MHTLAHTSDTHACIHIRIHLVRYACKLGCTVLHSTGRDIPFNGRTSAMQKWMLIYNHNYVYIELITITPHFMTEKTYIYITHTHMHIDYVSHSQCIRVFIDGFCCSLERAIVHDLFQSQTSQLYHTLHNRTLGR